MIFKKGEEIAEALNNFNRKLMPVFTGTVSAVDTDQMICDIEPIGQADLDQVRLKAAIDGVKDGVVEFPKVGSSVLCGIIGNDEDKCFVIKCSEVDNVVINGGDNGGLINIQTLIEQLGKATARIDGIIDSIKKASVVAQDGGAVFQTTIIGALTQLTDKEDYLSMEDDKVIH